jgi:outer membrane protein assembly factor BamB
LLWKKAIPVGHSSPCIWGDRIFITGFDKDKGELLVIALHRNKAGAELWRRTLVPKQLENVHPVSNPATATIATDGQRVYAYFGSYGLLAYTLEGKHLWSTEIPVAQPAQGSGVSPTLAGDLIIIARDYPPEPELLAYSKSTGKLAWRFVLEKRTGPTANTSHATAVLFKDHIVLHRPAELAGHSLQDGSRLWRVGLATGGTSTPVVTADTVFVAAYTNFGEPGINSALPDFASVTARADADNDGKVSKAEAPTDIYVFKRPGVAESIPGPA